MAAERLDAWVVAIFLEQSKASACFGPVSSMTCGFRMVNDAYTFLNFAVDDTFGFLKEVIDELGTWSE